MPKHLPSDLTTYIFTLFAATPPLYHVTLDDISSPERLEIETYHRPPTRLWPWWCYCHNMQTELGWTPQAFMGT